MNAVSNRNKVATQSESSFVRDIANPNAVLDAIARGHEAVANASGEPLLLAAAVAGTWLEIAELEGEDTANTITENVWPLDGSEPVELAVAA